MALTNNPNKTKSIEKKWNREINRRWANFWSEIKKIPLGSIVTNLDDEETKEEEFFLLAFANFAYSILLGGVVSDLIDVLGQWQNKYQTTAYRRSIERADSVLSAQIPLRTAFELFKQASELLFPQSHKNEINFLHKRANTKLTGWVQALMQDTNSIIHDNFGRLKRDDLLRLIKTRLDVTASRAKMIATTEITQASQRAAMIQAIEIQDNIGEEVLLRWITVRDSRVRHLHAIWHGKKFTTKQAEINMNISPWNCRCGLRPVVESKDTAITIDKFKQERKVLLARETKNLVK